MSELFESYEIVRVPYWPKIARIVGFSVLVHVVLMASVLYIPAIRNAIDVAGILSNTKFVDKSYKKTTIVDDVDVVDLTSSDRFQYPDGYFATGAPLPDPMAPVIIASAPSFPVAIPTPPPTPTPTPFPAPVVMPPGFGGPMAGGRTRLPKGRNPAGIPDNISTAPVAVTTPSPNPAPTDPLAANKQADQVAADNNVNRMHDDEINRAPLKDFVAKANDLYDKGQLNFSKPIEVVIDADLDQNAHFTNAHVVSKSGDGPLDDVSKEMVAALSDSGALKFLMGKDGSLDLHSMRFTIKMDQDSFNALIETDAPNADRARQMANAYGVMLGLVPTLRAGKDDEIAIAKGTTVKSDGTKLTANFTMPRAQAIELMKKQVAANKKPES